MSRDDCQCRGGLAVSSALAGVHIMAPSMDPVDLKWKWKPSPPSGGSRVWLRVPTGRRAAAGLLR